MVGVANMFVFLSIKENIKTCLGPPIILVSLVRGIVEALKHSLDVRDQDGGSEIFYEMKVMCTAQQSLIA